MKKINFNLEKTFGNFKYGYGLLLCFAFLISQTSLAQTEILNATGAGTFIAPCGVTSITVEAWGAGGGGQRANGNPSAGGGGTGGGYVSATFAVVAGNSYNYFIGTGGSGNFGNDGSNTWFINATTFSAVGGKGGGGAVTGNNNWGTSTGAYTTGNVGGTVSRYGGNGGAAGNNFSGGAGSSAGTTAAGNATGTTGGTAPTNGYAGVNGRPNNGVGAPGNIGAGGAGGRTGNFIDQNGGNGGNGQLRITYSSSFPTYCSPNFTSGVEPITNVTFAAINNTTTANLGGPSLQSFCDIATVTQGSTVPISFKGNTAGPYTNNFSVYIDWDQNGVFGNNTNERYDVGTINNSTGTDTKVVTGNINVPTTATVGLTKMRVLKRYNAYSPDPCATGGYGQAEDYIVNVTAAAACVAPTAQPTALTFPVITGSSIDGSFTASASADHYLVLMNTTGTAPIAPTNGANYAIGNTALGAMVIDNDDNTVFSATGLSPNTTYYFFVYAFNSNCTGGPLYYTTSPLIGNQTTAAASYCTPNYTTTVEPITYVEFGSIANRTSPTINGTPAFENFTGISTTVLPSASYPLIVEGNTAGNFTTYVTAFIDWNQNGIFEYPSEYTAIGTIANSSGTDGQRAIATINVPPGASIGATRMRILKNFNSNQIDPCLPRTYGQAEDYTIIVATPTPCTTPTTQPTTLVFGSVTGNSIAGSFTAAAAPGADHYLVLMNTTGTPPTAPTNGINYAIGNTSLGATVVDNDTNTTFTATGLAANTTYYFFIYSFNGSCSGGPLYRANSPLTGNTTTGTAVYCIPVSSNQTRFITDFSTTLGVTNITNNGTGPGITSNGYSDYTALHSVSQIQGNRINISTDFSGTTDTFGFNLWVDWNDDGNFDAGELMVSSGAYVINHTGFFFVPAGATVGPHRMRIRNSYLNTVPDSCDPITSGEAEDYTLNVIAAVPCSEPTVQASNLVLNVSGTTVSGSFTAASPAPDSYLVVYNTTGNIPNPVDGNNYAIGGIVGAGNRVADNDGNTVFSVSGLNANTLYHFFVFSYNNAACKANYLNTNPLTDTITTTVSYCEPTSFNPNGLYINKLQFVGTMVDPPANTSTFSTTGYQDFTGLSPIAVQAQGEGVNIIAYAVGNVHQRGTWKAWVDWDNNGIFSPSELVYNIFGFAGASTTFGFRITPTRAPGNYRMRIRVNNGSDWFGETFGFDFGPCDSFTTTWDEDNYGETEDYLFTVIAKCDAYITDKIDGERCGRGTVDLEATATAGVTEFRWYTTETGGLQIATSAAIGQTTIWTTPTISATRSYYVTAFDGICESLVRTRVEARISPTPTVTFTPSAPTICGDNQIIQLTATADTETVVLVNEKFNSGLGLFNNVNSDANPPATKAKTIWTNRTSVYVPTTNVNVWYPAISSGFGPNKFALALTDASDPDYPRSPVQNSLTLRNSVNTADFLNLTLELKFYYSRYYPANLYPAAEYVAIELSTDGGTTYNVELQRFTANEGIGTRFVDLTYNLTPYIGQTNLKFRIRQYADASYSGWLPGGVAVDNIQLFGDKTLNTAFHYNPTTVDAYTDPAGTLPYTPGDPITAIYIKPTIVQLERATFSIPVSASLGNGCSATGNIVVTNNTRIFKSGNTDWNVAGYWRPAVVPDIDKCVIIPSGRTSFMNPTFSGSALNVTVKDGGILDLKSNSNLTVKDWITVESTGEFLIRDSASLIQVTEGAPNTNNNTGSIKMQRTVPGAGGVLPQHYVYWSSPVENFNVGDINTAPSEQKYEWLPTIDNVHNGTWMPASGSMSVGKGYIVRGLVTPPLPIPANTAQFLGRPTNGIITAPITRGTYIGGPYDAVGGGTTQATDIDDNWNLVGNPYPSAIAANAFLDENAPLTNPKINGTIYLWSHVGLPIGDFTDDPFYGNYVYNYLGSNYITYNKTGPNPPIFGGNIAAGQSFFVEMEDGAGVTNNVTFNNSMRVASPNNANFLRTTENEQNRIWLDLVNASNEASTTLVGYVADATNDKDRLFDGHNLSDSSIQLYSLIGEDEMVIQGRVLPFDQQDIVPLGFKVPQPNDYTVAINSVDGLFSEASQNIYLEDTYLNIIHDLRIAPYEFASGIGTFNDRFILRYTDQALSTPEASANYDFSIIALKDYIKVTSGNSAINTVKVYDVLGRLIADYKDINALEFKFELVDEREGALIVKATLYNGQQKIKKVIY